MTSRPGQKHDQGKGKIRILIVDDHAVVREGLRSLIQAEKDFIVCGEAEDGPKALELIAREKPDAVIADLGLQGMSGLDLIKNIKTRRPQLPILVISMLDESIYAERALRAGARGYLMKKESADHVGNALRRVLNGKIYVSEALGNKMMDQAAFGKPPAGSPIDALSNRELEVFQLIGKGYKAGQIAEELNLGVKTVESYREQIKVKFNLEHSSDLTRYAIEWVHSEKPSRSPSSN